MMLRTKIVGVFCAMFLIMATVGYFSYSSIQNALKPLSTDIPHELEELERASKLGELVRDIRYLDEVSEVSLHNIIYHQSWEAEQRYYAFHPELERVIALAVSKANGGNASLIQALERSQATLKVIQTDALRHLAQGQKKEALELIESDQYQQQRLITLNVIRDFFLKRGTHTRDALISTRISAAGAQQILQEENTIIVAALVGSLILLSLAASHGERSEGW